MATLAQLLKARNILEEQLGRINQQLDTLSVYEGVKKAQSAVREDISSNNIQCVTDGLYGLYEARLLTEQGWTIDAKVNVQAAIDKINAELSVLGAN